MAISVDEFFIFPIAVSVGSWRPVGPWGQGAKGYRRALLPEGSACCLKNTDHFEAKLTTCNGCRTFANTFQEVLALQLQWFILFDVGHVSVAVVIRISEFGKRIVMR